ncbi:hypothetical protein BDC45DRAFT_577053 [Circinella umbellata]|nr:hypothetical protein BDC45DRAFT_577053 [Circinella umbellata]
MNAIPGTVVEHNITTYLSAIETNKKIRCVNNRVVLWTHTYVCHREGTPCIRFRPSKSSQKRSDQKPTKKIGCCAKLLVRCYQDDPETLKLDFGPAAVFNALDKIFPDVNFESKESRNAVIAYEDVYNLYYKLKRGQVQHDDDDFLSLETWLTDLEEKGYNVCSPDLSEGKFAYGIQAAWQKTLLVQSASFCLDAIHDVTIYANTVMYQILFSQNSQNIHKFTENNKKLKIHKVLLQMNSQIGHKVREPPEPPEPPERIPEPPEPPEPPEQPERYTRTSRATRTKFRTQLSIFE